MVLPIGSIRGADQELAKTMNALQKTVAKPEEESIVCPYRRLLEVLGKSHTLEILYGLSIRSRLRFTEIQKQLGLQPKTLSARLKELAKLGLIERKSYHEIPPRVDYELTQKGKDLGDMFDALHAWAAKYNYIDQPRGRTRGLEGRSHQSPRGVTAVSHSMNAFSAEILDILFPALIPGTAVLNVALFAECACCFSQASCEFFHDAHRHFGIVFNHGPKVPNRHH